jgi:chromosome segregation ATPase
VYSQQQQAVAAVSRELQAIENAERQFQNQLEQCSKAIIRFDRDAKNVLLAVTVCNQRLSDLKDALELARPQDGKLDILKEQLRDAEDSVSHLQGQYDAASEARAPIRDDLEQLVKAVQDVEAQVSQQQKKIDRAEHLIRKGREKRDETLQLKNDADNRVRDAKREQEQQADLLKEAKDTVKSYITEATKYCARVRVSAGETPKSLEDRLTQLDKQKKDSERRLGGSMNDLKLAALAAEDTYNRAQDQCEDMVNLQQTLHTTLGERKQRWKMFKKLITGRARITFHYLLSERAFRGSLIIDHKNKALELRVEPDITVERADNSGGRTTKTLSGGEKSFSTICMLLSMWDAMGSPIRCLDEFDVFMASLYFFCHSS